MECPYQKITYFARERFYIVCTNLRVKKFKCDEANCPYKKGSNDKYSSIRTLPDAVV